MIQQYLILNHEMTRLYVTNVAQELENGNFLKALKALLSKGRGRGEIGKHKGLKIPRPYGLVGSSPTARTIKRSCRAFDPSEGVSRHCVVIAPVAQFISQRKSPRAPSIG